MRAKNFMKKSLLLSLLLISTVFAERCGIIPVNQQPIQLDRNNLLIYDAEFGSVANPQAMTFSGLFKIDDLTDVKNYPLLSIKTTDVVNTDKNLTTYKDLFKVHLDKTDVSKLVLDYQESAGVTKQVSLDFTPVAGQWFNLVLSFDYASN